MNDDEKNFIRKVNIDKARNVSKIAMVLIIISILTYVIPLLMGEFDFGVVFEIISLIFLLISNSFMGKYNETRAKRYLICSMVAIGGILIYDLISLLTSIASGVDIFIAGYAYGGGEFLTIAYLILLFKINNDLANADNPTKYKEKMDWFYEGYDENKENKWFA